MCPLHNLCPLPYAQSHSNQSSNTDTTVLVRGGENTRSRIFPPVLSIYGRKMRDLAFFPPLVLVF